MTRASTEADTPTRAVDLLQKASTSAVSDPTSRSLSCTQLNALSPNRSRSARITELTTQLTDAGYRAFQAVEQVLTARLADATLSRLVFPDILADLRTLAEAAIGEDAEEVYRGGLRLAPESAAMHELLGDVLLASGRFKEALLWYRRASALDGADPIELGRKIERAQAQIEP